MALLNTWSVSTLAANSEREQQKKQIKRLYFMIWRAVVWIRKDGAKVRDNMAASGIWLLICRVKQGAGYCQRFLFVVNWSS
jgi:hypothetical protein